MRFLIIHPEQLYAEGLAALLAQRGLGERSTIIRRLDQMFPCLAKKPIDMILLAETLLVVSPRPSDTDSGNRLGDIPMVALATPSSGLPDDTISAWGLRGYLPTTLTPDQLIQNIKKIAAGDTVVRPHPKTPAENGAMGPEATQRSEVPPALTLREHDVVEHLSTGDSNKKIARSLGVQEITIKMHLRSIYQKLGVGNRTQAVTRAMQLGLINWP